MAVDFNNYAAEMTTQLALVRATILTIGSLQTSSPVVLQTVYQAVQNALAPFDDAISAYDADIDTASIGGVVAGKPAPQLSAALLEQTQDVAQQGLLVVARAYVARTGVNVSNSPG